MEITLTKGFTAVIDDEDSWVCKHHWRAQPRPNTVYALATIGRKSVLLHRLLLGVPQGQIIDHRDGNGLNNTRANLRLCSVTQNSQNNPGCRRTPFKGIAKIPGGWRANITVNKHRLVGRTRQTARDAAEDYDRMALVHFGEFARLNFAAKPT